MKTIKLTQGKIALVDDGDFDELSKHRWYAALRGKTFYAVRKFGSRKNNKIVMMHRVIVNTPSGMDTDHIDGNGLNNQKINLRICNRSQNLMNRGKTILNTSGLKGVYKHKCGWMVQIQTHGKMVYIGLYKTKELASAAYDSAATEYHGGFAKLNRIIEGGEL